MALKGKRIAMIIAPENFRDEEFNIPYKYFTNKGAVVDVFSTKKGTARGMFGTTVSVNKTIQELGVSNYDAIVFVGGAGTPTVRKEERAIEIAQEAVEQDKVLGAICWAPTILAKAGVLEGKNATVWVGDDPEYGMRTDKVLEKFGATFSGEGYTVDGKIVTANGPANAENFAKAIEKLLS
ncbi:MAG: DJ-1/PfpI family protein [Candidatus Anstonellales archaeon]